TLPRPPRPTLFPYTTLFRSENSVCAITMSPTQDGPTTRIRRGRLADIRRSLFVGGKPARRSGDRRQPVVIFRQLAQHHVEILLLQFFGDRAAATATDQATVELANRRHFRRRTGEEEIGRAHV